MQDTKECINYECAMIFSAKWNKKNYLGLKLQFRYDFEELKK